VVTALSLFDPHCALWALLELRALHKTLEGFVKQVWITVPLKFFTRLPFVCIRFAIQTIFFFAFDALEIFTVSCSIENKSIVAVGSRTPRNIPLLRKSLL
jgi:hypothetical protein